MMSTNSKLSWLKTFIIHGDFDNAPDDFDVFDETEKFSRHKIRCKQEDTDREESIVRKGKGGSGKRPPADTEKPTMPKFEDPLLVFAQFDKNDELLELIRDNLWEIQEFEMKLNSSFEQLENKFGKNIYQYDTTST
ncbi:hypothetical protein D0T84_04830 [Dysgonomonas sp. 521]|uniref:hypothetical protein n=1 Tax=Dysgonomonas sp. 521 TaxID=2302932 RepID=UPI0013D35B98|nr:hypothetical protein [Dysgonomonas sp. 521]NDV94244.1 hypothetical protein [Dysgonomonas sp. 521]